MSIPKRVLLVVPSMVSFDSFLRELSSALAEKGVEVHCACSTQSLGSRVQEVDSRSARLHDIPFERGTSPLGHLRSSLMLTRLTAALRPDLVHAHFSAAIFTTALARRSFWPITIGTFQGIGFPLMTHMVRAYMLRVTEAWSAQRLNAVWVLTDDDRVALQQAAPQGNIYRQPGYGFGCVLERFDPMRISVVEHQTLATQLNVSDQHRIFAFVGRFVGFKGFDVTIRAFLRLAHADPRVRLLLVGTRDPLHPSGLTPAEEAEWQQCPQIINLGWQANVEKYLSLTHVLVLPSQREGMPVSLMEALAMGVPVITANSRGCREVVRDQQDGFVLRDCTVKSLAEAMRQLAQDESLRQSLSTRAFADRERFCRRHYVQAQIKIYESALGGSLE